MTLSPESEAHLRAKVASLTREERAARAAYLAGQPLASEEDQVEYAKLVCGLDAGMEEFMVLAIGGASK